MCYNNYTPNQFTEQQQEEDKEWYETVWGIVILSLGLNLLGNWLYEKYKEPKKKLIDIDRINRQKRMDKIMDDYEKRYLLKKGTETNKEKEL